MTIPGLDLRDFAAVSIGAREDLQLKVVAFLFLDLSVEIAVRTGK
jgi:hypothetical protein